ncbi:MAG: hypothetical protein HY727_13935 [Candidatus Rokubacteria bacterium]|nr:hypothetical protein [Candidatus Rokubacteria bacterium]
MRTREWGAVVVGVLATVAVAGCAGKRIQDGVYASPTGYRIAIPGADWILAEESRADLELRHRAAPVGMLVNGACDRGPSRVTLSVLARQLLAGLRDREVVEQGEVAFNGRPAAHAVLFGRWPGAGERVQLELYVTRDARCVYDFLYAAPPALFETWRDDFRRFVETFATE